MGWLIALGAVAGLLMIRLGISAVYSADGPVVKLTFGPYRRILYPAAKKKKTSRKKSGSKGENPEKKGGSLSDFFPLLDILLEFLSDVRRKLLVNRLELHILLAGDDPCDLGMLYAGTLTAVHGLDPQLERLFRIRKKDIRVVCDFEGDSSVVWARLDLSLSVARVLSLGLRHGIKALREYVKIMKLRKGGATQ
jgi:hypothetical protein